MHHAMRSHVGCKKVFPSTEAKLEVKYPLCILTKSCIKHQSCINDARIMHDASCTMQKSCYAPSDQCIAVCGVKRLGSKLRKSNMRLNCMPGILHHYQGMHDARCISLLFLLLSHARCILEVNQSLIGYILNSDSV